MNPTPHISGIHHITAISASAAENLAFYENTLGLRLVKQTVNFDDPYTYHLYYGDARGAPGTILTFFPWENLPQGRPGAGMVTAIAFGVPRAALDFWQQRLGSMACETQTEERFGDPVLRFADPHGLPLELIGLSEPPATTHWHAGPIAAAHAITGFHSATATLHHLPENKTLLTALMGMTLSGQAHNRYRFATADPTAPGHFWDIVIDPQAPLGQQGGGTVHHIAFRTESEATQLLWQSHLRKAGLSVTDVRDRNYFRSIYFHAPQRVLFEIATNPPGFSVDEEAEVLGASLKLPRAYEHMRPEIEKHLRPLRPSSGEQTNPPWKSFPRGSPKN
ncbi:MAG: VOC family protein [Desulfatitalea sp.]